MKMSTLIFLSLMASSLFATEIDLKSGSSIVIRPGDEATTVSCVGSKGSCTLKHETWGHDKGYFISNEDGSRASGSYKNVDDALTYLKKLQDAGLCK